MQVQLPNGNTITVSTYDFLFKLKDEDVDEFYQSCMADNLGVYIDNPFSNKMIQGRLEVEEFSDNLPEEPLD